MERFRLVRRREREERETKHVRDDRRGSRDAHESIRIVSIALLFRMKRKRTSRWNMPTSSRFPKGSSLGRAQSAGFEDVRDETRPREARHRWKQVRIGSIFRSRSFRTSSSMHRRKRKIVGDSTPIDASISWRDRMRPDPHRRSSR